MVPVLLYCYSLAGGSAQGALVVLLFDSAMV